MRYKITSCKEKTLDNYGTVKDIVGVDMTGATVEGSVWKKQKDGTDFPNFDQIILDAEIELNAWVSPKTGKTSFFPPKLTGGAYKASQGAKTAQITKAMDRKEQSIAKSQDFKAESIRLSSVNRDAVLIATTKYAKDATDLSSMEELITYWRKWLWEHYDDPNNYAPF